MPRMLALGRVFELDAEWDLATDIYHSVERYAIPAEDGEVAADAALRIGFCARMEARWDDAMDAYLRAERLATILGDRARKLRGQLGHATVVRQRGNWPLAARLLDETIAACEGQKVDAVCAPALHERAILAFQQREFEHGLTLAARCLAMPESAKDQDRIMTDMATALLDLGMRSAARDAYLIIVSTTQDRWSRWLATINLLELEYLEGREQMFDRYRMELRLAPLPPSLSALYHLFAGRGLHAFGYREQGNVALQEAISVASEASINDVLFQAEESLRSPSRPIGGIPESLPPSDAVADIASELRYKREKAGV